MFNVPYKLKRGEYAMKKMLKIFGVILVVCTVLAIGSINVEAASILSSDVDLKGYDSTVTTQEDGSTLLTNKKGEYVLDETSSIYSSKAIKITLSNTSAANIQSISVKGDLYFRGNGELNVSTTEDIGINVTGYFKPFYETKYGEGKITSKATKIGLLVKKELMMKGGVLEATGEEYGIYGENDVKTYNNTILKGTSSKGTGIYAYRDIYAWKGATVVGEGEVSGARSVIAHIQAEDAGSSITGILTNNQSEFSALHADKQMLRAYKGAVVREEYKTPEIGNFLGLLNVLTDYPVVARNMNNIENYNWVALTDDGQETEILIEDGSIFVLSGKASVLKASRNTAVKTEVTQLKTQGVHEVLFTGFTLGGNGSPAVS